MRSEIPLKSFTYTPNDEEYKLGIKPKYISFDGRFFNVFSYSERLANHCKEAAQRIDISKTDQSRIMSENPRDQWEHGAIAECVVKEHFGFEWSKFDGPDGGRDMKYAGLVIDIKATVGKTRTHHGWGFKNNLCAAQIRNSNDAYIFCFMNPTLRYVTINGWIMKKDAVNPAWFHRKGELRQQESREGGEMKVHYDCYELLNDQFSEMESLIEIDRISRAWK